MSAPSQRRLIFAHIDEPGYTKDIACYLKHGGYEVMKKAFTRPPAELMDEVKKSGLRGRGGAGFPAGIKWRTVLQTPSDQKGGRAGLPVISPSQSLMPLTFWP